MSTGASLRALDLVSLRLLVTAIDEGNLAKVAARENISLSAVSRRISDLEARLGVQLLHRRDRGVVPTDAALMALGRMRSMFNLLDQIVEDFRDVRDGAKGVVRVRAHLTAIIEALPERVAQFKAQHDGIDIVIEEATSSDIVHAVQVGDCDIGLVSGTVDAGASTLLPWGVDRLVVVMPRGHRLEASETLRFVDLIGVPFIGMSHGTSLQTLFRAQAAAIGQSLDERTRVSTFEGVLAMIAAGLGISILPARVVAALSGAAAVSTRELDEPWAVRPLMICVRDLSQVTAASKLFIDYLMATPQPA